MERVIQRGWIGCGLVCLVLLTAGCKPYRVEYHKRPAYYRQASAEPLIDEIVLEDGTIVRFVEGREQKQAEPEAEQIKLREEDVKGNVTIRALLPEHVVAHLRGCLVSQEYELIYNQLLANSARNQFESGGGDFESFKVEFSRNRSDLVSALNRMSFGMLRSEVILERVGTNGYRYRFIPQLQDLFKFNVIEIVREDGLLKLHGVR
ncbi:MAG: hypothetical protein CMJ32_02135 [Phycisphaerae bacterium]|nr:hypothetical protein [Phycisphaerae bacterium]